MKITQNRKDDNGWNTAPKDFKLESRYKICN